MSCDNFRFLLVRTYVNGQTEIVSKSDNEEEIGRMYCRMKAYEQRGVYRYDMYKLY